MTSAQTTTRQHDWKLLTMTDVIVVGCDPETAEPFGIVTGDTREGINCGTCGVPCCPETEITSCEEALDEVYDQPTS